MSKRKIAVYTKRYPVKFYNSKWHYEESKSDVIVMIVCDGYAMVRHRRCAPFVVLEKEIKYK